MNEQVCSRNENEVESLWCFSCGLYSCDGCDNYPDYYNNKQVCIGCSRNENEVELVWCNSDNCGVHFCFDCALECDNCPDYDTDFRYALCPAHTKIFLVSTESGVEKLCDTCCFTKNEE